MTPAPTMAATTTPGEGDSDAVHTGFAELPWQVHKFGGTSVATAECFLAVARVLEHELEIDPVHSCIAIVVSAVGGKPKVTDLLLDTVKAAAQRDAQGVDSLLEVVLQKHHDCLAALFVKEPSERDRLMEIIQGDIIDIRDILKTVALMKWQAARISELVSGYGELWSAQILTALMRLQYVYLDARRVITVDEEAIHNGAVVWELSQEKLDRVYREELQKLPQAAILHFVITGYVASNTEGVATTLQRDGSDYSAAIMGRLLQAHKITIWTDVDGVLSADPRRVPLAQILPEVSYTEAMELAYFGAKVIHPKTMQPAISSSPQIPIFIRNTFNPSFRGTRIYAPGLNKDKDKVVTGFSSVEDMALLNVEGSGLVGVLGVDRRLFATLERIGVNVVLISQGSSEHSVTFATKESQANSAKLAIEEEFRRELLQHRISKIEIQAPCSILAAVGDNMALTTGVAGRFFSALGDAKINILAIAQGSSERNISAVVLTSESSRALRAVHAAFRLSHSTVRVAIVGMNELGISLLKLLESQRSSLRSTFDIDLQVCTIFGGSNSLLLGAPATNASQTSFRDDETTFLEDGGRDVLLNRLIRNECPSHVIFDCTNDEELGQSHAAWLRAGVNVVTANNTGISGPAAQREEIAEAERAQGKNGAKYLREVTVGGGLPVINTLRSLLHSGDKIRRIDGILSVSLSFIMFRISPATDIAKCTVKEAIALGLMEEDPTKDLNNEYTSRVLMVLAKELNMDKGVEVSDIRDSSDKLLELICGETVDYTKFSPAVDELVQARVDAAKSRGCVLRHIASVDVKAKELSIKVVEVPEHHVLAVTPPSCECVRFFTHRHQRYPLIVQGPSAGADSTASALLAELLQL
ncbi:bifunctional aspartokinase, partial [Phaeodactylum tricornutum CCAP 1055/1]